MMQVERLVKQKEPTARCVHNRQSYPDNRYVIMADAMRALGWGCNRLQAWRAAHRLVYPNANAA